MIEPSNGLVIRYSYLWAREHDRQEESGRKDRPVCVQIVMRSETGATMVALFPITSVPPRSGQTAVEVPEVEARRGGLRSPAWVIVNEFNTDDLATSYHVAETKALGRFSVSFMRVIRSAAAARIRARNYRRVPRQ